MIWSLWTYGQSMAMNISLIRWFIAPNRCSSVPTPCDLDPYDPWNPKTHEIHLMFFQTRCIFAKHLSLAANLPIYIRLCDLVPGRRLRPDGLLLLRSHSAGDRCEQGGCHLRVPGRHARSSSGGSPCQVHSKLVHRTPIVVRFNTGTVLVDMSN